ncbi:MAG: hypothetical protein ACLFUR_04325 [Candidatus Hadarchaeia archaeon]
MTESKRLLQFPLESTDQLIKVVNGITEMKADIDLNSTPSTVEISIYGSESKVKDVSKKIRKLVEESKNT